jgi:hypothetical protein
VPSLSAYSWNRIAGQAKRGGELPPFQGDLLEYHLQFMLPKTMRAKPLDAEEAAWIASHFDRFDALAARSEPFGFALGAVIDWRYSRDPRAAVARLWAGIEALLPVSTEVVYRVSLCAATVLEPRGPARVAAFKHVKGLYDARSKAVHGAQIADDELTDALRDSFEVLRKLLLDAVERGAVRSAEDFLHELLG